MYDAFIKAAWDQSINEKFHFYQTSDTSCAEKYGLQSTPGISLIRNFDDSPVAYTGSASRSDLVSFAKKSSVPQLIVFTDDYIEPIFAENNPAVILMTE